MKKVAFHTLGCKVNSVETEQLIEAFLQKDYEIVPFEEIADIYVVNTCTVTHVSDRKSRAVIRRAIKRNPDAIVAAVGCLAQTNSKQLADIEGIDLVVGNRDKEDLPSILENHNFQKGLPVIFDERIKNSDLLKTVIYSRQHEKTRAFIKIQDGCQSFCSYCIVPQARGPVRSKTPEKVVEEVNQLVTLGYKEIVLTGIHTGTYGIDLKEENLSSLLLYILDQVKGEYRIRLSSLEPLELDDRLLDIVAGHQKICRHLHIPLQSGSNRILSLMNRRYTREYYQSLINKITRKIPGVAVAADIMVGFPGEDKQDFFDTRNLLENLPLHSLHVFKYSPRPGTKAALMKPQVEAREKTARSESLLKLAAAKKSSFINDMLGQKLTVLVQEHISPDLYLGLSDNYIEIQFHSPHNMIGSFVQISPERIENQQVIGQIID
ncbi:MAG: tRNA (N(6)-L-threonylcarbamoyladenosine(37)-C(2))-methylthiotransferase MtaB [Syntrophomonadaceae bacterium]|nr:tRNA (N(6)-L-threonylcarbamoyladenosine(37)-C(2))-methylthiotransferase MtaB [Syntrophomonadaceae bacterium]